MTQPLPLFARNQVIVAIWGLVCVLVLSVATGVSSLLWNQRQAELAEQAQQLARIAAGAEVGVNRTLLALDVLLATTEELLGQPLAAGAGSAISEPMADRLLAAVARQSLNVRHVALLDASGRPLASSSAATGRLVDDPPPDFVARALAQRVPTLLIGEPLLAPRSAERVIYLARPVLLPGGQRLLAVAQVPLEALAAVLLQGIGATPIELTLERASGELLLGLATAQGLSDAARASGPPLSDLWEQAANGWHGQTRLRGVPGQVAGRALMYGDLWVTASLAQSEVLRDWQQQVWLVGGAALLLALTLVISGGLAASHIARMQRARAEVAQSKALLDQALASMVSGFVLLDAQHRVVQWNPRFEEFFPWLASVIQPGVSFRQVLEATVHYHLPGASAEEKREWVRLRMRRQVQPQGTLEQRLPSGRSVQITERMTPDGGLVIVYHDVTELRQAAAEIELLAFYDPLTGLPNRRLLLRRIDEACAATERSGEHGALLFIDLDRFKTLNDTLGHEMGDLLLQQVGHRLQAGVRSGDVVARLGGDEFVVALLHLPPDLALATEQARTVAGQILGLLARPYTLGEQIHHSSASVGVTLFSQNSQAALEILKQADIAMYEAKAQHGNVLRFYDPAMQTVLHQRASLLADLKQALPLQQFRLHLQPQFDAHGRLLGAEALLRWQHPERGLVPPGLFIPVAEDSDLILAIGQWVLVSACELLVRWQADARLARLHLSVNVSARQFRQADFPALVGQCLEASGARAQRLELELTETLVLEDVNDTIAKMHQLRARGVRFALDDFGTGYSSLAYLTRLPLHRLKIDRSFVQQLGESPSDDVVVQTILGMARNLDLEVVAEGVETPRQHAFLQAHRCAIYQGYLFARPMPIEEFETLARGQGEADAASVSFSI
ncbi:hypothetical protein MASR1M59_11260 [Melaminivora sp.]